MTDLTTSLTFALQTCGHPALETAVSWRLIGQGAWHDAYLVEWAESRPLVIRLRKKIIYGEAEPFDAAELHSDYAQVGLYYTQANHCQAGICPIPYDYYVSPELSFTVEGYLGERLDYTCLTAEEAFVFGRDIGRFFRRMHQQPAPLAGYGEVRWQEGQLIAERPHTPAAVWREMQTAAAKQIDLLTSHALFQHEQIAPKVHLAITQSTFAQEPFALVNRDITPENLIAQNNRFIGLIDPVVRLGNPTRFAALFVYCYRFLLAAYNTAPRYATHQFRQFQPLLQEIANGYLDGYTQGDLALLRQIDYAYYLYLLDEAAQCYTSLQTPLTARQILRQGNHEAIAARLASCLHELVEFSFC